MVSDSPSQADQAPDPAALQDVSRTAWFTVYLRTLTDIPLCAETFNELGSIRRRDARADDFLAAMGSAEMAPRIECRYKLIEELLRRQPVYQVLELAAGLSPRGMNMEPSLHGPYVELDLPGLSALKRYLVTRLTERAVIGELPRLHLVAGSALDADDIRRAASHLTPGRPVAVVMEGLLPYLTFEQKAVLARNVHEIVSRSGGLWISSDGYYKSMLAHARRFADVTTKVSDVGSFNMHANFFDDPEHAVRFFSEYGWHMRRETYIQVANRLASLRWLETPYAEFEHMEGFVLRPAAGAR